MSEARVEPGPGELLRGEDGVWLVPARPARASGLRVVGPGRRERVLGGALEQAQAELARARAELEAAALCERGTRRFVDRVEEELLRERAEAQRLREAQARLVLALGALQRENELLGARVQALAAGAEPGSGWDAGSTAPAPGRPARKRRSWPWRRARA